MLNAEVSPVNDVVDDTALSTARRDGTAKVYLRRPVGRIVR